MSDMSSFIRAYGMLDAPYAECPRAPEAYWRQGSEGTSILRRAVGKEVKIAAAIMHRPTGRAGRVSEGQ